MLHSLPPLYTKERETFPSLAGIEWPSLSGTSLGGFGAVQGRRYGRCLDCQHEMVALIARGGGILERAEKIQVD